MGTSDGRSKLIASVYSGLGNRMRVLLSAREAAALADKDFGYFWQIDHRFQARLHDLWEFDSQKVGYLPYAWAALRSRPVESLDGLALDKPLVVLRSQQPVKELVGVSIDWKEGLRRLAPTEKIRERVKTIWNDEIGHVPYVGVMVRAHQQTHRVTKETSPPSWFIQRMLGIAETNPGIKFFLSCDDQATQDEITGLVPGVVAQKKTSQYNSREGVVDAVVDLYLAAFSSHLIGPHWSSFVDMAEALSPTVQSAETPVVNGVSDYILKERISASSDISKTYPWVRA